MLRRAMMAANPSGADPYWSNVVALLHFDGADSSTSFPDETGRVWTPKDTVVVSTAASVFGGASGRFDSGRLQCASDSGFAFDTGNFTIEGWVRFHATGNRGYLYSNNTNTAAIILSQGGLFEIYGPSSWVVNSSSGGAFVVGTWYHIAVVRVGNTWNVYRNGVLTNTATDSRSWGTASGVTCIGMNPTGTATPLLAFIDDFRVTKGVARYLTNFTPPAEAFPSG